LELINRAGREPSAARPGQQGLGGEAHLARGFDDACRIRQATGSDDGREQRELGRLGNALPPISSDGRQSVTSPASGATTIIGTSVVAASLTPRTPCR
jgi:hypothetical protein